MALARPNFSKEKLEFSLLQSCLHEDDTARDSLCDLSQLINPLLWSNLRNPTCPDHKNLKLTMMLPRRIKFEYFPKNCKSSYKSPCLYLGERAAVWINSTLLGVWSKNFHFYSEMCTFSGIDVLHNCISRENALGLSHYAYKARPMVPRVCAMGA